MAFSINDNIPSKQVDRQLHKRQEGLNSSLEKLASGKRINRAADDPAGLAVALDLLAVADTAAVATRNISDGVSAASIADGAIQSASDITVRLSELAQQSANGTLSAEQRTSLNNEYQQLTAELDRISATTEFNGQKLLSQSSTINIQAGTDGSSDSRIAIALPGVSSSSLGLTADISTADGARQAVEQTRSAQQSLAKSRGEIGSGVSRLTEAYENLRSGEVSNREAASRILDADVADESAKSIANQIGLQSGVAIKVQANQLPQLALNLLK